MKKIYLLFFFAIAIISCKKDKDSSPQGLLEGSWTIQSVRLDIYVDGKISNTYDNPPSHRDRLVFRKDNTGTVYNGTTSTEQAITYQVSGDALNIDAYNSSTSNFNYGGHWVITNVNATRLELLVIDRVRNTGPNRSEYIYVFTK